MRRLKASIYTLLVFFLSCFVKSDVCRDSHRLLHLAESLKQPESVLYLAALEGSQVAVDTLGDTAASTMEQHWLLLAAEFNSVEAIYSLAMQSVQPGEQKRLLTQAAELGHQQSQFELALLLSHPTSKLYWLEQAAGQQLQPAIIALYQWHLLHEDSQRALPWLKKASEFDANSAFIYARMLWRLGDVDLAEQVFQHSASMGHTQAANYLQHIRLFWHQTESKSSELSRFETQKAQCTIQIQTLATSLEGIINATQFQQNYAQDKRLDALPICLNIPILARHDKVQCASDWQRSKRLGCDMRDLETVTQGHDFSHLVVIADEGKANVYNGIMFLDLADTYDVFVHELAHFAGFVDEYPLSSGLAESTCVRDDAPNLIYASEGSNLDLAELAKWFNTAHPVRLSSSRTCNNHQNSAYKPVNEMTFMEFYDQGSIPDIYLTLWLRALQERTRLVPASVNFAQANARAGEEQKAAFWWQKYRQFIGQESTSSDAAH